VRQWIGWFLIASPILVGLYSFIVYPAILWVWSRWRPALVPPPEPANWPMLTILIVAYNEEVRLRRTIEQALAADYPPDRLELLVVSDASTDGTDALVENFGDPRVRLLRMPERKGKAAGENASGDVARGDIVVSIDASILIPSGSLKPLVRAFTDPTVGLASGRDISVGDQVREGNQAESSYVGLEMKLRHLETRVHSIVGASGCFYAVRKALHQVQFPEELSRDFAAASNARAHGFRAVSVDEATCLVPRTRSLKAELRRKSRTMGRGLDTLFYLKGMMNPFRYPGFSFMLISHKLMRWLLFPALLGWMIGPLFLIDSHPVLLVLTAGMLLGLRLGSLAANWPDDKRLPTLLAFPGYAFVSIMAGWAAWWHLLKGDKSAVWEPTQRPTTVMKLSPDGEPLR
jgi:cellulose synthase/poly-beta-1,6-N-acetylglucosamine synthase-like glycosyltransferase